MKKSEKVFFAAFKVIYIISLITVVVTYISDIFDPTAVYCRVTANDWISVTLMTIAIGFIADREKQFKSQLSENDER